MLNDNLEAAFATPGPVAGQQITFGRVRIRLTTPSLGTYTITRPQPTATRTISLSSTRGGVLLAIPVMVRN